MNWNRLGRYLADRGLESSTWRGLVWGLTAVGITIAPHWIEPITVAGMTVAGILGALCSD